MKLTKQEQAVVDDLCQHGGAMAAGMYILSCMLARIKTWLLGGTHS